MAERSKFQFRMRELLWAVSFIAVALALATLCVTESSSPFNLTKPFPNEVLFLSSAGCFGAGLGSLFRQARDGAACAILIAFVSWILFQ